LEQSLQQQFWSCSKQPRHDRRAETTLGPGGILLENQDVGGNVQRRMGEPMRWLCPLLLGKAGGRGYRKDLFHSRFLPPFGRWPVRLQGLSESLREGVGLRPVDAEECAYAQLAAPELRVSAGG